ncbi:MAG: CHAT domain-containing protein [Caldilinea sp.]
MADITDFVNFDLLLTAAPGGYRVRVVDSPAGEATGGFALPFSNLELENLILRLNQRSAGMRRLESPELGVARTFGTTLFGAVFAGDVGVCWQNSRSVVAQQDRHLRLRLRLSDTPELLDLPWELLFDPASDRFVALSSHSPLVRFLDVPGVVGSAALAAPLRILTLFASPADSIPLDIEKEWQRLTAALRDQIERGAVVIDRVPAPTLSALQRTLRRADYHVFHFVGHGGYDERAQDGVLVFADESGASQLVTGQYLGALLHDERSLRLAVLNACDGARTSRTDPFAGVGQSLLRQGIPAVIAMQFAISDAAATVFAHEFYAATADGYALEAALTEARKAMFAQQQGVEWATPVLYTRTDETHLFDRAALNPPAEEPGRESAKQNHTVSAVSPTLSTSSRQTSSWRKSSMAGIAVLALLAIMVFGLLFLNDGATAPTPTPTLAPLASEADTPKIATPPRTPVTTLTAPAESTFVYDFADGAADGWTGSSNYWRVVEDEEGRYVYQAQAPADLIVSSEPPDKATLALWRDYAVEMKVRVLQPTDHPDFADMWVSMRAAYQPKVGCEVYHFFASFGREFGLISPAGDDDICPFERLVKADLPLSINTWAALRLETRGDVLTMWVDGQEALSATDDRVDAGYFYLNVAYDAVVQFADIRVYQILE